MAGEEEIKLIATGDRPGDPQDERFFDALWGAMGGEGPAPEAEAMNRPQRALLFLTKCIGLARRGAVLAPNQTEVKHDTHKGGDSNG